MRIDAGDEHYAPRNKFKCDTIYSDVAWLWENNDRRYRLHRNTMISHDALIVHLRHRKITKQEAENKHTKVVGAEL
jgi:hypothetical protein